jgi:DNA-binding transcriptional LysR family regulator
VPLLVKHGRRVRLTAQAHVLLDHGARVAAQLERARADLDAHRAGELGRITIGAFGTAITSLVAPALELIARERPRLAVTVRETEQPESLAALAAQRLDIVVAVEHRAGPSRNDSRFHREPLLEDRFDAVLPPDHRLAHCGQLTLAALARESWVIGTAGHPCWDIVLTACAASGFTPEIAHHVDDWNAVVALVAAGAGVGIVPRAAIAASARSVAVKRLAGSAPVRVIYAALRAGSEAAPHCRSVVAALRQAAVAAQGSQWIPAETCRAAS